jgi:excisionase family DNA binding protein
MVRFVYGPIAPPLRECLQRHEREREVDMGPNGNGEMDHERLLTPAEVAALFRVDPKTVTRWAKAGKLSSIRTLGGHRRYWESEVRNLLERSAVG